MSIGSDLRRARKLRGLTQADLASQAGVTRMTVQRMEADEVDPKLSTVLDAARCVGLDLLLVPSSLRQELQDFIRAGGKLVAREPGLEAPPTAVQDIREQVIARLRRSQADEPSATGVKTKEPPTA